MADSDMKTMVDFVIDVVHYVKMRQSFVEAVKGASSHKDIQKFFDNITSDDGKFKYEATDDECMRIYENKVRISNNPWVKDNNVKGY